MTPIQIDQYDKSVFTASTTTQLSITHDVYSRGDGDKVVVIIQELPGIGQETLTLADRFVARGYRVVLPHLFGPFGKLSTKLNFVRVCISREFHVLASHRSSPVVDWLAALCQKLKNEHQVPGVATIGMCLTGSFAISLMADDAVLAGYASQPSMPFFKQKQLHMSPGEITAVKAKLDRIGPMKAARFDGDGICKAKKFTALAKAFNEDKERIQLKTLPGKGHAVLTLHYDHDAQHPTRKTLDEVMDYFDGALSV